MTLKDLVAMDLHERQSIDDDTEVVRVNDGWIYLFYEGELLDRTLKSTCFVAEMSHTIRIS